MHRSDLLSELVGQKPHTIAMAGTHGKTTTTAMAAHALTELGADPAFFVGGEIAIGGRETNAHWGAGDVAVVEADESDRSFLKLNPEVAIVTNVELEHHQTYPGGIDELMEAFDQYAANSTVCVKWRGQRSLAGLSGREGALGYGIIGDGEFATAADAFDPSDLIASELETPADPSCGTSFKLTVDGQTFAVQLAVRGDHNVLNSLAVIASLRHLGYPTGQAVEALAGFSGVGRRFERIGTRAGATIYDDYGHHPTELRAALNNARSASGDGRVIAVYQPHLFSRVVTMAREIGEALALADVAIITAIYPSRERREDFPNVTGLQVAVQTYDARPGMRVHWTPDFESARAALDSELRPGDVCIAIGAGDISAFAHKLVEAT